MTTFAGPEFWSKDETLLFGHVREDIDLEIHVAGLLRSRKRAMVITSGGCTALALRSLFEDAIYSVDINPAQNRLGELKLAFVKTSPTVADLRKLHGGDARTSYEKIRAVLSKECREFWDRNLGLLMRGVHRCGSIDRKLGLLRFFFHLFVHGSRAVRRFLKLSDPEKQRIAFERHWNSPRWNAAVSLAFHPRLLRTLLGAGRTKIPDDLPGIMKERFRSMLTDSPAVKNRAAHELFLGKFPPEWENAVPHLRSDRWSAIRCSKTPIHFLDVDAAEWLAGQPPGSIDLVSLSNILEQAAPEYRAKLLSAAEASLAPGGILVVRSILPWPKDFKAGNLSEIASGQLPVETSGICSLARAFRKQNS